MRETIIGEKKITYPNKVCLVFNPNYILLNNLTEDVIEVEIKSDEFRYKLDCRAYKGRCSVYISKVLELFFDNPRKIRSKLIHVEITSSENVIFSFDLLAVWGNICVGERFGACGSYDIENGPLAIERKLIWFKSYPFTVSLFTTEENTNVILKSDGNVISQINLNGEPGFYFVKPNDLFGKSIRKGELVYDIMGSGDGNSSFDYTFDRTFFPGNYGNVTSITKLVVSEKKCGFYLRWIDRHGYIQYYLFDGGTVIYKSKHSSTEIALNRPINGMYAANTNTYLNIQCCVTYKVCATSLEKDIFNYVISVIQSPYVDLYLGKDKESNEIWLPVRIEDSNIKFQQSNILNDIEITFALPNLNAQSL